MFFSHFPVAAFNALCATEIISYFLVYQYHNNQPIRDPTGSFYQFRLFISSRDKLVTGMPTYNAAPKQPLLFEAPPLPSSSTGSVKRRHRRFSVITIAEISNTYRSTARPRPLVSYFRNAKTECYRLLPIRFQKHAKYALFVAYTVAQSSRLWYMYLGFTFYSAVPHGDTACVVK